MAVSFVNYQLRTPDAANVAAVAEQFITNRGIVSPAKNDWVTLYDEISDQQDPAEIDRLAHDLSLQLHVPLLVFLVRDSSLFVYYLFDEEGCLLDEYNSAPEYFGLEISEQARLRFAGQPALLEPYCKAGRNREDVARVLSRGRSPIEGGFATTVPAEERVRQLALVLGIDEHRARLGYNLLQALPSTISDLEQFTAIQSRRRPRNPRNQVLPRIPPKR